VSDSAAIDQAVHVLLREVSEAVIMPRYRNLGSGDIVEKATDDLVTVADREAEIMLAEGLRQIDASLSIVGEEAAHSDPSVLDVLSGDCWIIDPIDGTSNFASGKGHFAIMIAQSSAGETTSGWIYDPVRKRLLSARKRRGAFVNGDKLTAIASGDSPPNLSAMTRFMAPDQRALFEAEIVPQYTLVKAPGCAAEEYPRVAFGTHDVAIYERTLPWDHAAGCLFLNEAGGVCARQDGSPYRVDSNRTGMIAAANHQLWDDFVGLLDRSGYRPGN
jgi:fructose-1,6-bisphosphatase/inositol monophosphatase family enzyme